MKKGEHVKCRGVIYHQWKDQVFKLLGERRGYIIPIDLGTPKLSEAKYVWAVDFDVTHEPLTKL